MPRLYLFTSTEAVFHPPVLHEIIERHRRDIVGAAVFAAPRHASLSRGVAQAFALDGWAVFPRLAGRWLAHKRAAARGRPPNFGSVDRLFAWHRLRLERFHNPNDPPCLASVTGSGASVVLNFQPWYLREPALGLPVTYLNAHAGALPKYRGVEPVVRALLAGETTIGVSVHTMTKEIDGGAVLAQRLLPARSSVFDCYLDTFAAIPDLVDTAIAAIEAGTAPAVPASAGCYGGPLTAVEIRAFRNRGLRYI